MCNIFTGAELVLRHIRNGVELDPIDINRNYDFDFQQLNFIPNVQILPVSSQIIVRRYDHGKINKQFETQEPEALTY